MAKKYWLMKSEPTTFSIDDLKGEPKQTTFWDGVRNYQARNLMMKNMQVGDEVFFYHSNAKPPGIVGTATVVTPAQPDPTQHDRKSKYYDPKATKDKPIWYAVEIQLKEIFSDLISLDELKAQKELHDMTVTQRGSRLSVQPVEKRHWDLIHKLAKRKN